MSLPVRLLARAWAILPVGALGFLVWIDHARMQRVEYVSHLAGRAGAAAAADPASPTGYAHGQRELIVPERSEPSFDWIAQTQQMFARREWRVRRVDYDNAPFGREVSAASPYRWWLGAVAWVDHEFSGRPLGLAVERAALLADPVLHGLLLIGGAALVAWQFGGLAAALFAIAVVGAFPIAAGFLPGAPDDRGLAAGCALGGILMLLVGMRSLHHGRGAGRWFAFGGIMGGLGVWVSVPTQVPILAGVCLGAVLAASLSARRPMRAPDGAAPPAPPWRLWALCGGAMVLVGYLAEYFPGHLGAWRLQSVHPLYGLAWIGAGELLTGLVAWIESGGKPSRPARGLIMGTLAAAAIAAVPVAMKLTGDPGILATDMSSFRLTNLPHGVVASSFWAWLVRDGFGPAFWAVVQPVLLVLPGGWLLLRRQTDPAARAVVALALGPVAVALAFACWQLAWWHLLDAALLALAVAALPAHLADYPRSGRWLWAGLAALFVIPGVIQLWPQPITRPTDKLTSAEAEELIERQLAHWLTQHAGRDVAVVFAPPHQTASLAFYGGLGGIGTFNPDNRAGLRATITLASVTSLPEAQTLIQARGIRYLVIPSWDSFFDEYAQRYLVKSQAGRKSIFIPELRRLHLPPWLRAWPCPILNIGGYEGQSVLVLEVVDEQSPPVAMGRLAEYLVETGALDQAAAIEQELRRFPGDVGALAARAQVASARGDEAGFKQLVDLLLTRLATGADRYLLWDRRVSLAIVLARADRIEPARAQVHRCLAELDDRKARSLTVGSLFNLLVLSHAFDDPMADPRLQARVLDLLPPDLRSRLTQVDHG